LPYRFHTKEQFVIYNIWEGRKFNIEYAATFIIAFVNTLLYKIFANFMLN